MTQAKKEVELMDLSFKLMDSIDSNLAHAFSNLILFLYKNPDAAPKLPGKNKPLFPSQEYLEKLAEKFSNDRVLSPPKEPKTIPDELVSLVINEYYEIPEASLERAKNEHLFSMAAENIIGLLLEHYLASILEKRGWVWCSGASVRAVDFIKPPKNNNERWIALQVKNRDNSENSSSSAIRDGTDIKKWFRSFSKKKIFNWEKFPDEGSMSLLSESGFRSFVKAELSKLKTASA